MAEDEKKEPAPAQFWAAAGQFTGYGLQWALSTLLFLMGGWWLDGRLGLAPLFTILGAFVGAGAGFYSLYSHIMAASRDPGEDEGS